MFHRHFCKNLLLGGLCASVLAGCGNRQGNVAVSGSSMPTTASTPVATACQVRTFQSTPAAVQFNYPADWVTDKAQTAIFAIAKPKSSTPAYSSLSLDIPKLPWHLPGMITVNMVANGYINDLKKHQIHDAVVKEECPLTVCGASGRRITCAGHENGNPSIDVAVVLIHADQVYILSADSDQAGYDSARKTLDDAVASLKWTK
jgi:hypothetical protein